jgi:uncharacterized membrane protein
MRSQAIRRIAIAGVLSAIAILLGATHWGFIPWLSGAALTVMHVPAIIGAVLEGPVVGLVIGGLFGLFSLIQGAIAPTGPADTWFVNPLISVLPRLLIGPVAWLVYRALERANVHLALIASGIAGSLTNSILVLSMISLMGLLPWPAAGTIAVTNGLPEAAVGALITWIVVAAWKGIRRGRQGADL